MKISEIIKENSSAGNEVIKKIDRECSPFLAEVGGWPFIEIHPLWRGMKSQWDGWNVISPPIGRRPRDTPKSIHDALDLLFLEHAGVKYRSDSIFCTGSLTFASEYGNAYAIFPIGEYKYCWSPKYYDLTIALDVAGFDVWSSHKNPGTSPNTDLHQFFTEGEYQFNTGIRTAIRNGNEIMLYCAKVIAIDIPFLNRHGGIINTNVIK